MRPAPVVCSLALAATVLACPALGAQTPEPPVPTWMDDAAKIVESLREYGVSRAADRILTQAYGPQPQQRMDGIADTLMNIAINLPGGHPEALSVRSAALHTLARAGTPQPNRPNGMAREVQYVPYAGSGTRLIRILQEADEPSIRWAALYAVARVIEPSDALPLVQQAAMSSDSLSVAAIEILNARLGEEGLQALRQLHAQDAVTNRAARLFLARVAWSRRWPVGRDSVEALATGWCRGPSGLSEWVRKELLPHIVGSDSTSAKWRELWDLPRVSAEEVVYVTDEKVCRAAASARGWSYEPLRSERDFPGGFWVLKVGPARYIVFDWSEYGAGSHWLPVHDASFNFLQLIRF